MSTEKQRSLFYTTDYRPKRKQKQVLPVPKRRMPNQEWKDIQLQFAAVYGKQEASDRGRHPRKKDSPGFQPKFAFLAGLDLMVHQRLYPESQGLNSEFKEFYDESIERLPQGTVLDKVRGDSALYSQHNIRMFEREGVKFGISASKTSHMWRAIELVPEEC